MWVGKYNGVVKFIAKFKIEILLLSVLIVSFFLLRLPNLTLQPIFADEAIYVRWAQVMKSEPTLRFLPLSDGKTPLFMWIMMPLFKVFSDPLFAGRFLSVIAGLFTLFGVYLLARKVFGKQAAFWAGVLYVITPYIVFFDRMALVDSMLASFTVWIVYFALILLKSPRFDLAMVLGYLMGGAILTKTPGMVNLLILPLSLVGFVRRKSDKYGLVRLALVWGVAIIIALVMYNMLRLGPEFRQLSARNGDYIFSLQELSGRPLDPFIPHLHDMEDWFPKLFTYPILLSFFIGVFFLIKSKNRSGFVVLIWLLTPMLISMAFLKTFTARYLLPAVPLMIIFAGYGLSQILEKIKAQNYLRILIGLIIVLPLALYFNYQLLMSPPPDGLPKEERMGYFEEWTAGYGFKEIAQFLIEENQKQKVVVGTDGYFGTLPDGLQIYLDKSGIAVVGSGSTISAQVKQSAKDNKTFFVGNKNSLDGKVKNVLLIKEFPKTKPLDDLKRQDSTVLYQVLP